MLYRNIYLNKNNNKCHSDLNSQLLDNKIAQNRASFMHQRILFQGSYFFWEWDSEKKKIKYKLNLKQNKKNLSYSAVVKNNSPNHDKEIERLKRTHRSDVGFS